MESMKSLNEREREILNARRLSENTTTLEELSKKYKVSRERIRQIETKAFEKLQKMFSARIFSKIVCFCWFPNKHSALSH